MSNLSPDQFPEAQYRLQQNRSNGMNGGSTEMGRYYTFTDALNGAANNNRVVAKGMRVKSLDNGKKRAQSPSVRGISMTVAPVRH